MRTLIFLLLLAACTLGPDFSSPAPPQVDAYVQPSEAQIKGKQRIVADKPVAPAWWKEFHSAALDQLVTEALAHNPDIAAARATLAQTAALVNAERGMLLPQLSLNASATRQKYGVALFGSSAFAIPPFTAYQIGPEASWSLDLFGSKKRSIEQRQAQADYQAQEVAASRLSLVSNVVAQALAQASGMSESKVAEQIIADDERNVTLVRNRLKAGAGTRVEVLGAESQLDNDRSLLPPLQQDISTARHALAVLNGYAPADAAPAQFTLADFTLPQELPQRLPAELVHFRPDILAAEANLHAASAAIGMATANLYPDITLTAATTQEALTPGALFKSNSNAWAIAAKLTAPLFNGGTLTAEKRAAEQAYQAALETYRSTLLRAFQEVADTLTALAHDAQAVDDRTTAVKTAEASLHLARLSYQAGNTGILQILDAERQSSQARLGLTRAKAQQLSDTARLFVVLGGVPPE